MSPSTSPLLPLVPKVLGADVELGNFLEGLDTPGGSGYAASRALLREIRGVRAREEDDPRGTTVNPVDWGRTFLPETGGCAYIDSDHLEIALPETRSAFDHVAHWRAMLRVVRDAAARVNSRLPDGCRVHVIANCSDGLGQSYGSHVNVLMTREGWNNLFHRKPHYLAYLAAFQISSLVYTGQGKVGSEHGRPDAPFQISQRADFFEVLAGTDTMVRRSIVNSRDEPLCGPGSPADGLARLHVIFYDSTLCQVASVLRAGTLQLVVALLEAGQVDPRLNLDDPLAALETWSSDLTLQSKARTADGDAVTAVELQARFLDAARRFADRGAYEEIVPRFADLLALWGDTLGLLRRRDEAALARRLDWVLKRQVLQQVLDRRPDLEWTSPEIKHLDQVFAHLDESDGLFWAFERRGLVDRVVSDEAIERAVTHAPEDTRAWTRAALLARAEPGDIDHVDWDTVRIAAARGPDGLWRPVRTVVLAEPLPFGATRADHGALFATCRSVSELADALPGWSADGRWPRLPALPPSTLSH
jgi:proteasome accessory factor A